MPREASSIVVVAVVVLRRHPSVTKVCPALESPTVGRRSFDRQHSDDILLDNTNDKERTSRLIRTSLHKSIIPENNYQLKIFIEISPEGEKIIQINIYHIKLIFRADTLTLLKNFIYQGFPVYNEKNLKDLPNQCNLILI